MASDLYDAVKKIIQDRHEARVTECRDSDSHDRILRVQGAARELKEILGAMELLENPQEAGED
jgi:hypothetical protein